MWELRSLYFTSTHLKSWAVITGHAMLWSGLQCWRTSPGTLKWAGAPRMKDISIRHVDVHLIISDICLIFRFPRLLMLISAAHLIFFFAFCAHWEMWVGHVSSQIFSCCFTAANREVAKVGKSSASSSTKLRFQNVHFKKRKKRKETSKWVMNAVKINVWFWAPFNFS